ncbi:MAG: glycosyltransferase family 4 protein [Gemmatimonadetes bacterium]|nr:glycosyltransferase family 4 protein [Gemmatimonadota bacterium]
MRLRAGGGECGHRIPAPRPGVGVLPDHGCGGDRSPPGAKSTGPGETARKVACLPGSSLSRRCPRHDEAGAAFMIRVFLLGARGGGGEEVFVRDLAASPPPGVGYTLTLEPHESVPGARARAGEEVLFNRIVHPFLWPLLGLRSYRVGTEVDLVHVHNHPTRLRLPGPKPVVYSVGGAGYPHYLETYLGWSGARVRERYRRARRVYRSLGIRSEVATPEWVDAVVVFSEFAADRLAAFDVSREKIHVIPPGFDIPAPSCAPGAGPFTFLLVGREPVRKGADLAVEAIRELRSRGLDVRLRLVGDVEYPGWTADGIEGHGPVSRDVIFRDFYAHADAALVPSRAEGYGFAAVEAMGMGLPVVAARRDALPEIVGDAGLLVEPGARALAGAMASLASDPSGARALGVRARQRFEERFTRVRARAALGAVYQALLEG